MRQITPHPLWLGHMGDGSNYRQVLDLGIRAVVQVAAEELPPRTPRDLILCHFPLIDGPDNETGLLRLAITTVAGLLEHKLPTLVCCGAGLSRSPAVAAAALALAGGKPLDTCLEEVTAHQPADVTPGLWYAIKALLEAEKR